MLHLHSSPQTKVPFTNIPNFVAAAYDIDPVFVWLAPAVRDASRPSVLALRASRAGGSAISLRTVARARGLGAIGRGGVLSGGNLLDEATLKRLESADEAALDRYAERILTASSLDELFAN